MQCRSLFSLIWKGFIWRYPWERSKGVTDPDDQFLSVTLGRISTVSDMRAAEIYEISIVEPRQLCSGCSRSTSSGNLWLFCHCSNNQSRINLPKSFSFHGRSSCASFVVMCLLSHVELNACTSPVVDRFSGRIPGESSRFEFSSEFRFLRMKMLRRNESCENRNGNGFFDDWNFSFCDENVLFINWNACAWPKKF